MSNETVRSILDRRSIRQYKPDSLTDEQISLLKDCALASPTAMNRQSWHFTFVTDREVIDHVDSAVVDAFSADGDSAVVERINSRGGTVFYKAPLVVFISCDKVSRWGELDAGIAVQNLAVAAHSLGLGSVIIGLCDKAFHGAQQQELEKLLCFPEGHRFAIAVCIGYPDATKEAHPIHEGRITDI